MPSISGTLGTLGTPGTSRRGGRTVCNLTDRARIPIVQGFCSVAASVRAPTGGSASLSSRTRGEGFQAARPDQGSSATRNIAEGFGRFKHGDFARFVRIAKASEVELLDHFNEAFDSGYLSDTERRELEHAARKAIKTANGLIQYLESTPDPPAPKPTRRSRALKAP